MTETDNDAEKRETLADIVAEIRAYGAQPPPRLMWLEIADRIEAAWRRECEELREAATEKMLEGATIIDNRGQGNAAAMSEALVTIRKRLVAAYVSESEFMRLSPDKPLVDLIDAAISAPARNCDAMSRSMCTTQFSTIYEGNRDGLCDVQTEREKNIHLYYIELIDWLFAPAAERKGEGDGR